MTVKTHRTSPDGKGDGGSGRPHPLDELLAGSALEHASVTLSTPSGPGSPASTSDTRPAVSSPNQR